VSVFCTSITISTMFSFSLPDRSVCFQAVWITHSSMRFYAPDNPNHVSYSLIRAQYGGGVCSSASASAGGGGSGGSSRRSPEEAIKVAGKYAKGEGGERSAAATVNKKKSTEVDADYNTNSSNGRNFIEVEAVTLRSLLLEMNVSSVNILKMDIEGSTSSTLSMISPSFIYLIFPLCFVFSLFS